MRLKEEKNHTRNLKGPRETVCLKLYKTHLFRRHEKFYFILKSLIFNNSS